MYFAELTHLVKQRTTYINMTIHTTTQVHETTYLQSLGRYTAISKPPEYGIVVVLNPFFASCR